MFSPWSGTASGAAVPTAGRCRRAQCRLPRSRRGAGCSHRPRAAQDPRPGRVPTGRCLPGERCAGPRRAAGARGVDAPGARAARSGTAPAQCIEATVARRVRARIHPLAVARTRSTALCPWCGGNLMTCEGAVATMRSLPPHPGTRIAARSPGGMQACHAPVKGWTGVQVHSQEWRPKALLKNRTHPGEKASSRALRGDHAPSMGRSRNRSTNEPPSSGQWTTPTKTAPSVSSRSVRHGEEG